MATSQVSSTALITTYARAYHVMHDDPLIFNDYLAKEIITGEEHAFFGQNLAASLAFFNPDLAANSPDQAAALDWVMKNQNGPITLSRSRYTEDCLEQAVEGQGIEQYIILGAGFDTFAFRQSALMKRLRVFEIDHPATQTFKRTRLSELGWDIPEGLHFVPVDLDKDNLEEALKLSTYDLRKKSFFSWLGVTYYLNKEAILSNLRSIAKIAPAGSILVFDYIDTKGFDPEQAAPRMQKMQALVARLGEPMSSNFETASLAADLVQTGFRLIENIGPKEIESRYFQERTDGYHAFEHVYFARAQKEPS